MAQFVSRGGSDAPATEVLTVADLLSRNAPVPAPASEPDTGGISVGALLRREGRAPHAADRPLKPRPRQEAADDEGGPDRRALVRRGAIAAGTLLAAGSVLGAAILTDVTPTANEAAGAGGAEDEGPYPGQGLLDQEDPVVTPPESVLIDQAAASDPLDPGTAAPTDWVPVAFPDALAGSESGTDSGSGASGDAATNGGDTGGGGSSGGSGDEGSRAAAASDDDENARSTGDGARSTGGGTQESGSGSSGGSSGGESSGSGSDDDDDRGLLGRVGDTVNGLTGALGLTDRDRDGDDRKRSSSENDDKGRDEDEDEDERSFSLFSAGDEDSSAPQDDEDDSASRSSDDGGDDEGDDGDGGDDDGGDGDRDRGLVGTLTDTVGGLLG